MPEAAAWVTPLLLLPGVGLLLVSTSTRYDALHEEIHRLLEETGELGRGCALHCLDRARLLRTAMVSLYGAAALLAASGLLGALTHWWLGVSHWTTWVVGVAAFILILWASIILVRESSVSLSVVESHAREIASRSD